MAYAAATPTAADTAPESSALPPAEFDLAVEGMTCASCVGRVEKALKRVPGVTDAAVNLATERAHVTGLGIDAAMLVAAVDRTGFHASPIVEDQAALAGSAAADEAAVRQRRELVKLLIAAALSLPLVVGMIGDLMGLHVMPPGWLQLALATPVQFWLGCALLPRRLEGAARRHRQHGPAGRARHLGGLRPERCTCCSARAATAHAAPVFRGVGGGHHAGPAGQMAGGPRQAARPPTAIRALHALRPDTRARAPRRRGATTCRSARCARRHGRGAARRARPGGRRGASKAPARSTRSLITGESLPVGQAEGDRVTGGVGQRRGPAGGRDAGGRRRDHAGAHRPPGRVGAGGQGADPAPGGPGQRGLRAGGAGDRAAHLARLVLAGAATGSAPSSTPWRCW